MIKKMKQLKISRRAKLVAMISGITMMPLLLGARTSASIINLPEDRTESINLLLMLTVLALVPSILILMTGFTRIIIVLSFVRNALGLQQMPPNQVLIGLALILNLFFMAPILEEIKVKAYDPYIAEQLSQEEAINAAMQPLRGFMFEQTYTTDLEMFMNMAEIDSVPTIQDVPSRVLIPAFITSELKRAFQIGFFIFVPFLVVDMIVASTLMSMGMMMLPPTVISLPFKILLFVLVDGWGLIIQTLFASFQ